MPIQTDTLNRGLYDLLTVRYDDVTPLDSKEKTTSPEEADIFKLTFEKDGETYGKVYVTIDNSRNLILYYGDEVGDSPDTNTSGTEFSDSWSSFRNMLKQWSQRKQLDFELKNKNHLAKDMAQRTYNKEKENLGESYYPMGKRGSYSDAVPNVKIIIQHTRQIGEGEQRYRNIDKIFVENTMGERFAVPSNKPGIAKVYARHIAEGGSPYDDKGRHITSLVEEYTKMAGFVRATKNKQFNESTNRLIQEGVNHYQSLRETLSRMIGRRGYHAYFEAWQPILSEEITEEANLNELFVQETIDPRIESVMPILSKLYKKVNEMKEINQLEAWADNIVNEYKQGDDSGYIQLLQSKLKAGKPLTAQEKEKLKAYIAIKNLGLKEGDGGQTSSNPMGIPEEELDEGKGAIRKFLAGLGIMGALGAYISSEDEAILQKMAVKYDQAQTPQERAQIKHDIERVTKGSLVKEDDMEEGSFKQTPGQKQYGVLHSQLQSLANSGQINTPAGKQKAEKMIDTIQQLVDTDPSCAGSTVPSKKIWLSEQDMAEGLESEGYTFKNSLHTIIRVATHLEKQMSDDENFPEWESEMIGSVKDQMVKIMDYEISKKEQGVAEGFPHDVDHMLGKTIKHQGTNCTTCHGRKSMYKLGSKLFADNKQGAEKVKCPTCKGTGDKPGVAEGSLNEGQYEMMMRNGQVKKFIAKDDADAKRIAAGHGAKSVIKLRGGVPAGKIAEQGVAEGLNEMDKSAPQPGRDGKVSHSTYGSRDKKGSDYFKGKEAPGKPITKKQMEKDTLDILKKQGMAEGKFFDSDYLFAKDGNKWKETIAGGTGTIEDPYTSKFNGEFRILAVLMRSLALQMAGKDPSNPSQFGPTPNKLYYKFNNKLFMGDGTNKIMSVKGPSHHEGVAEAYPKQQAARYNPNGTTYKGSHNKMPILDPDDPVHNADRYGLAYDEPYEMDFDKEDLKRAIAKGMSDLPDTAKRVLELRFWEDMTYEKVASELGLSKERIRQIEAKALRQLRHPSRSDRLRPFVHPEMAEDLDANQKRVGQLGPYEKVGPQGAVGKLVGAEESIREGQEDLDTIRRLLGK